MINNPQIQEEPINSKIENYYNICETQQQTLVNVKDFGAIGNGENDDWNAINNAYNTIKNTGGILYFPTGIYAISKPIQINTETDSLLLHNITIKGVDSTVPYFNSYSENPTKLAMNSNIIPTTNFSGDCLIKIGNVNNSLIVNIALIGAKTNQEVRTIDGIIYSSNSLQTNNSIRYCCLFRLKNGINAYNSPIFKCEYTNVQYCKNVGIIVRGDSRIVECEVSFCGTQLSGIPNEMKSSSIFQSDGYYGGTGIKVIDGAGNTSIIGGLIDWNCKGIVLDAASGVILNAVRFHNNAEQHIWIRSRGNGLGTCGFNISGCRFLGGGFLNGSLNGKSAITITNDSNFQLPIYGNICSNVFRYGDWDACEDSDQKLTEPTETCGPLNSSIIINTNCNVDLTLSANDFINCSVNGALGITQTSHNNLTKIKLLSNNISRKGWISGNVQLFEKDCFTPSTNGIPNWIGDNGDKVFNANSNPYDFDEFIYNSSSHSWIGINQRNIQFNTTSNRPALSEYSYSGFKYYDTTINKIIIWNGSIWIDCNGNIV